MTCANCGYWAFTARGNDTATCNRCGKKHDTSGDEYTPLEQATTVMSV